jgi:hypothetical protein
MKAKRNLKGKEEYKRIFVNDDITPLRARLLGYVKQLESVEKAYTVDGRIYCVTKSAGQHPSGKPGRSKPVIVESPDNLFRLGVTQVDYNALGLGHLAECVEEEMVSDEEE